MARRKELRGIASGLFGSFISRNNDVNGYWGIGKLCSLAQESAVAAVKIDLLSKTITPESLEFSKLIDGYCSFLEKNLSTKNIPSTWVVAADIDLEFKLEDNPAKRVPIATWGNIFKLSVAITDDKNKKHTISGFSYCAPHNPRKERQSLGRRF